MTEKSMIEANRELWDAWTGINAQSDFYDLESFRAGQSSLQAVELEELGPLVAGKSLLHLQCHFGLDTLSWARLGARVTGLDLSGRAIELARSLASDLDLDADFICSDVLQWRPADGQTFDIVFTSYGVLDWLPDLDAWAEVIVSALAPGGLFYMVEFHPLLNVLDDEAQMTQPYFQEGRVVQVEERGSYADPDADFEGTSHVCFHTLGEVVSALARGGLRIEMLTEHPYSPYDCFPFTELAEPGRAVLKGRRDKAMPLLYSLQARKQ